MLCKGGSQMPRLTKEFFKEHGREGGKRSRANLAPEARREAAKRAALARWNLHVVTEACVDGAEGDLKLVKLGVEGVMKDEPRMLLRHWEELLALSAEFTRRAHAADIEWASRLVKDVVGRIGRPEIAAAGSVASSALA